MLEAIQHDIWVFAFESSEWPFSAMAQDHRRSEPSFFSGPAKSDPPFVSSEKTSNASLLSRKQTAPANSASALQSPSRSVSMIASFLGFASKQENKK